MSKKTVFFFLVLTLKQGNNNSNRFSPWAYGLPNLRFLASLTVLGIGSIPWNRAQSQEKVVPNVHSIIAPMAYLIGRPLL